MNKTVLALCIGSLLNYYPLALASDDAGTEKIQLMLAQDYHQDVDLTHYWYSEKLDGIRVLWDGKQLRTRRGRTIAAPLWFTERLSKQKLDGELWAGRGRYHLVQQTVLDHIPNDAGWRQIQFMVFDSPDIAAPYLNRYQQLKDKINAIGVPYLHLVEHFPVKDRQQLFKVLDAVSAVHGEGLILRDISQYYRQGRSDALLKLKKFSDSEGTVIGYKAGTGRLQGKMGALHIQLSSGIRFYLGSGFTDKQREAPPPLGTLVTFRFNGLTHNGIPKFARFVRQRVD